MWQSLGERGILIGHFLKGAGNVTVHSYSGNQYRSYSKNWRQSDHDSVTAVLCVYLRDSESTEHREICPFVFMAILPSIARERNQAKCPSVDSLDKENLVHIHNRIIYIHKGKWNDEFCRKVDATENFMWSKISQPQSDTQTSQQKYITKSVHVYVHPCVFVAHKSRTGIMRVEEDL